MPQRVVCVTGASAGLGRAIANRFGASGAAVAVLARGRDRLDDTVRELESAGGRALAVPVDVADWAAVRAAAEQVEAELGPIDVWVNNAMASVFTPFKDVDMADFHRATEVNYLGFVHGTKAALEYMLPRNRGVIVQVSSALALRSIPLQSAYCDSKHAIVGFTESLRTELLHDHSRVRVTMVHMPAMNTPQFDWVRSSLPNRPQPVAPIYQPEVAAGVVFFAADHPRRRSYNVGGSTTLTIWGAKTIPGVLDHYLARTGYKSQQDHVPDPPGRPDNLSEPVEGPYGAHGRFDERSHDRSAQVALSLARTRAFSALRGFVLRSGR